MRTALPYTQVGFNVASPLQPRKRSPESDKGRPGSARHSLTRPPRSSQQSTDFHLSQFETVDRTVTVTTANGANLPLTNNCVLAPFLSKLVSYGTPSLVMLPASILNGMAPNIGVTVNSCVMPMMMDSGAEVSVAPLNIIKSFDPPITIPSSGQKIRTFGNSTVHLSR